MRSLLYITVYSLALALQTDLHFSRETAGMAILVAGILLQMSDKTECAK